MIRVDSSEIANWASKPQASYDLPELIRRLILATVPQPSLLRIPSGSSVRLPGWDGVLDVEEGNEWVPKGTSVWEMSCEGDAEKKANADYGKRTAEPRGVNAAGTTLAIVTSRTWQSKDSWLNERRAEGHWHDIKVLDSVDLAAWL